MRRVDAVLAVAMALSLSGCVLRGKPKTVSATPAPPKPVSSPTTPPPPEKLSVPQTTVELPLPQPLSAEAVASTLSLEEEPIAAAPRNPKTRPGSGRTVASQRPETVGTSAPSGTTTPPVQPPPTEPERPQIEVIVPQAELNRLQAEAVKSRQETSQRLEQIRKRRLNRQDQDTRERAQSFVKQSEEAQRKGDIRLAYELASRGLVLAKQLVDGR